MGKLVIYMIVWSLKKMKVERNVCEFWRIVILLFWGLDFWKIEVRSLILEFFFREKKNKERESFKIFFKGE